jgi:hydroxymethylbilane synthase
VRLRAATRGSELARWQTDHIAALLREVDPSVEVEPVVVQTHGDRRLDVPIWEMGGKGAFVKEVQAAVLDGRADLAVHSGKDLPSETPDGLVIAAVPERGDPRDALVGCRLDDLPTAASIGTGSVRRRAQLAWLRPDLVFGGLRGAIGTRLDKAAGFDAIVMASTALDRLGLGDRITERLDPSVMVPQVAQAALAVECRRDDERLRALLARIEHAATRRAVDAERAYLAGLGGGCDLPAGAHATVDGDGGVVLEALLATLDGRIALRHRVEGDDPVALGTEAARHLRTCLPDDQ